MYAFNREEYEKRVAWFQDARFGMFIHWGLYAIPARGEWIRSQEQMSIEEYNRYFEEFDPKAYDPKQWARIAKKAGMKYVVMTAKHHDGFCLFDSQYTDYKSTNTKCGRDLIREYLDAFRAEGIRVGVYYSLLDWHHPDYPHYQDLVHPMRNNPAFSNENRDFNRYLQYMHAQVRELCTNYGKLDIIWFDFSYDNLFGEAWKATELVTMVRELQPGVLIDNRLEGSGSEQGSLMTGNMKPYHGDFACPEQMTPSEGLVDQNGRDVVWEASLTMNNHWGYCNTDQFFKPADMLVKKLVECVSKGGNMLLNVGPDANGRIPAKSIEILEEIGRWMEKYSESIYGCGKAGLARPDFGRITRKDEKTLYYHIFDNPVGPVPLTDFRKDQILEVLDVATGAEIPIGGDWVSECYPEIPFAVLGENPVLPDSTDTVIKVVLK